MAGHGNRFDIAKLRKPRATKLIYAKKKSKRQESSNLFPLDPSWLAGCIGHRVLLSKAVPTSLESDQTKGGGLGRVYREH